MKPSAAYVIAFAAGFSMMGLEILGSRVLAPVYGSSAKVWGALIAVFMAGLSVGYLLGGAMADRRQAARDLALLLALPALMMAFFPCYGVPLCHWLGNLPLPHHWGALLTTAVLFIPACVCLGAISPGLIRRVTPDTAHVGRSTGRIFAVSTVGCIAGTLFTSFYLIGIVGTGRGMLVLAIPLFLAAAVAAWSGNGHGSGSG